MRSVRHLVVAECVERCADILKTQGDRYLLTLIVKLHTLVPLDRVVGQTKWAVVVCVRIKR